MPFPLPTPIFKLDLPQGKGDPTYIARNKLIFAFELQGLVLGGLKGISEGDFGYRDLSFLY